MPYNLNAKCGQYLIILFSLLFSLRKKEMTREYSLKKFFHALFFMYFVLIFFESHSASHYDFNANETNCSSYNSTNCDFCGPGTIYNSSKSCYSSYLVLGLAKKVVYKHYR